MMPLVQSTQRFYAHIPAIELAEHDNLVSRAPTTMDDPDQDRSAQADVVPPPVRHPNPVQSSRYTVTSTPSAKSEDAITDVPVTVEDDECIEAESDDDEEWWNYVDWNSDASSDSSPVTSPDPSSKVNESTAADIERMDDGEQMNLVTDNGEYKPFLDLERLEPAMNKEIDLRRYAMVNWQVECNEARDIEREDLAKQIEA
ncbi:hypothetical protein EDD37DRAFT_160388 [Exophiala viscosa]|uniref:Uncharacterized protein n=1 Tax=Exophiala viscosa TaxID=2486360 RepID=A0AAN6DMN2_9EURO|nr:hypothetical protein EDD36DRAFT_69944 [Exophiala viscosa]KAI1620575.1 hypothetical protein EDD37DRAFT_160388 [Exophiala viscosa]